MIKAIIFDFGRVISAQKPPSLFRQYEAELGLQPDTLNPTMFDSKAWQDTLMGRKTAEEFWLAIGPELGLKTEKEIKAFWRRYHADETINGDVLNLIRRLHGQYKLAILSNSPPGLTKWLAEWDISDLFDVVFCSGDEGVTKPDPTAYNVTLLKLHVEPGEAVFIDDTPENVEAARALGIHGIVFTSSEKLEDELRELLAYPRNCG